MGVVVTLDDIVAKHTVADSDDALAARLRLCYRVETPAHVDWLAHKLDGQSGATRLAAQCLRLLRTWTSSLPDLQAQPQNETGFDEGENTEEADGKEEETSKPWGNAGQRGEQLVPLRQEMVDSASVFLGSDKVSDQTLPDKAYFLLGQGVSRGEVRLACHRKGISLTDEPNLFGVAHSDTSEADVEEQREAAIKEAVDFLTNAEISGRTLESRVEFLKSKVGAELSEEELEEALKRVHEEEEVSDISNTQEENDNDEEGNDEEAPTLSSSVLLAVRFLQNPSVAGKSVAEKTAFLRNKKLAEADIQQAFAVASGDINVNAGTTLPKTTRQVGKTMSTKQSSAKSNKPSSAKTKKVDLVKKKVESSKEDEEETISAGVKTAISFFKNPQVIKRPVKEKLAFLKKKGISESDVAEARTIVGEKIVNSPESREAARKVSVEQAKTFLMDKRTADKPMIDKVRFLLAKMSRQDVVAAAAQCGLAKQVTEALKMVDETPEGETRADWVQKGVQFMKHPSVKDNDKVGLPQIQAFLTKQGLTPAEIRQAIQTVRVSKVSGDTRSRRSALLSARQVSGDDSLPMPVIPKTISTPSSTSSAIPPPTTTTKTQPQPASLAFAVSSEEASKARARRRGLLFLQDSDIHSETFLGERVSFLKAKHISDDAIRSMLSAPGVSLSGPRPDVGAVVCQAMCSFLERALAKARSVADLCLTSLSTATQAGGMEGGGGDNGPIGVNFEASPEFCGARMGYVFKMGVRGLGYYADDGALDDANRVFNVVPHALAVVFDAAHFAPWLDADPAVVLRALERIDRLTCVNITSTGFSIPVSTSLSMSAVFAQDPTLSYPNAVAASLDYRRGVNDLNDPWMAWEDCERCIVSAVELAACTPEIAEYASARVLEVDEIISHSSSSAIDSTEAIQILQLPKGMWQARLKDDVVVMMMLSMLTHLKENEREASFDEEYGFMLSRSLQAHYWPTAAASHMFGVGQLARLIVSSLSKEHLQHSNVGMSGKATVASIAAACAFVNAGLLSGFQQLDYPFVDGVGGDVATDDVIGHGITRENIHVVLRDALFVCHDDMHPTLGNGQVEQGSFTDACMGTYAERVHQTFELYSNPLSVVRVATGAALLYASQVGGVLVTKGGLRGRTNPRDSEDQGQMLLVHALCEALLCGGLRSLELMDRCSQDDDCGRRFVARTLFAMASQTVALITTALSAIKSEEIRETTCMWLSTRLLVHGQFMFAKGSDSRLVAGIVARRVVMGDGRPGALGVRHEAIARVLQTTYLAVVILGCAVKEGSIRNLQCAMRVWDARSFLAAFEVHGVSECDQLIDWVATLAKRETGAEEVNIDHLIEKIQDDKADENENDTKDDNKEKSSNKNKYAPDAAMAWARGVLAAMEAHDDNVYAGQLSLSGDDNGSIDSGQISKSGSSTPSPRVMKPLYNWMLSSRLEALGRECHEWLLPMVKAGGLVEARSSGDNDEKVIAERAIIHFLFAMGLPDAVLNQQAHIWLTQVAAHVQPVAVSLARVDVDVAKAKAADRVKNTAHSDNNATKVEVDCSNIDEGMKGEGGKGNKSEEKAGTGRGVSLRLAFVPKYVERALETHPHCTTTEMLSFAFASLTSSMAADPCEAALGLAWMIFARLGQVIRRDVLDICNITTTDKETTLTDIGVVKSHDMTVGGADTSSDTVGVSSSERGSTTVVKLEPVAKRSLVALWFTMLRALSLPVLSLSMDAVENALKDVDVMEKTSKNADGIQQVQKRTSSSSIHTGVAVANSDEDATHANNFDGQVEEANEHQQQDGEKALSIAHFNKEDSHMDGGGGDDGEGMLAILNADVGISSQSGFDEDTGGAGSLSIGELRDVLLGTIARTNDSSRRTALAQWFVQRIQPPINARI